VKNDTFRMCFSEERVRIARNLILYQNKKEKRRHEALFILHQMNQHYITLLNPNDVISGRGPVSAVYEGNTRFRVLARRHRGLAPSRFVAIEVRRHRGSYNSGNSFG
jgi:hypothetical protein